MIENLLTFMTNHWILTSIWSVIVLLLVIHEGSRGGLQLSPAQVTRMINNEDAVVIDIRKKEDFRTGHLPESINIAAAGFDTHLGQLEIYKKRPVILVCKTGTTAGAVGIVLKKAGFDQVSRLKGGITEWQSNGLPLVKK